MQPNPLLVALKTGVFAVLCFLVAFAAWQSNHLERQMGTLVAENARVVDRLSEVSRKVDDVKTKADRLEGVADTLSRGVAVVAPGTAGPEGTTPRVPGTSTSTSGVSTTDFDADLDPSRPLGTPGRHKNFLTPDPEPWIPAAAKGKGTDGDIGMPYSAEPKGFNSITENDASLQDLIYEYVGEPLARRHFGNPSKYGPALCWRIEVSPDYREWTLFFRKDAVWHPPLVSVAKYPHLAGTHRVTAKDYKFTLDMIRNPQHEGASMRGYYTDMEGVELVDDFTAVVRWKDTLHHSIAYTMVEDARVFPEFLYAYGEDGKRFPDETIGLEFNSHFYNRVGVLGCGPYRMAEFVSGDRIVLERFPDWYGVRDGIVFPIRRIRLFIYNDPETVLLKMKAGADGEINVGGMRPMHYKNEVLDNDDPTSPFKDGRILVGKQPRARYAYFGWKNTHPLFRDRDVRKALALACNRKEMAEKIFLGLYTPMSSPVYPGSSEADPTLKPLPFDLDQAKALLDGAGWTMSAAHGLREKEVDGQVRRFEFELIWPAPSPEFEAMLNQYKNDLLSIGVKMEPKPMQWAVFQKKIHDREFEAMTLLWVMPGWEHDFDQIWHSRQVDEPSSSNMIEFKNAEVDRLSDDLKREMDPEKRAEKVRRIGRILYEEQPYCFFGWSSVFVAHRAYVKNVDELWKIRPFLRTYRMWVEK
jgi:peptide/nickel transport system substrate-binding protein